jgi:8-oxo-dGTP diphosphatase
MTLVVAAVIERENRQILIGQRRKTDTSALKWEFPGGKVKNGETPEAALARELREELGAILRKAVEIARVQHQYSETTKRLEIRFYAARIAEENLKPKTFEQIAWVLPKELAQYDFLAANARLIADLSTGRIQPREILEAAAER